ncbi:hypothetical protein ACRAWD_05820 [Caulobacter segnis]
MCAGVFVWEPAAGAEGKDRFVGEVDRNGAAAPQDHVAAQGAVTSI